jgi:RimJ/RimL family protein N-acetyltransferase
MHVFLETRRLVLRRFTTADVDNLFDLNSDPDVMRFINDGIATARDVIQNTILPRYLLDYERLVGYGRWATIEKTTGHFIGWFSLRPRTESNSGDAELGYWLRRTAWGRGCATEGARALIRKAFLELGMQRVFATTYQDNHSSRRVMEKAGLRLVRTYRLTPADLVAGAANHIRTENLWDGDEVENALFRADWESQEAAVDHARMHRDTISSASNTSPKSSPSRCSGHGSRATPQGAIEGRAGRRARLGAEHSGVEGGWAVR